ncbi:MAG: MucBP domain-containing protein, partial [Clostridia bacterium]|nr:MucBP domain-containing protein [Clostridia bacterium]
MKKFLAVLVAALMLAAAVPAYSAPAAEREVAPAHVRLGGYAVADKSGSTYSEWVGFYDEDVTALDHYDFLITTYAGAYCNGYVYGYVYGYNDSSELVDLFYRMDTRDHSVEFIDGASANGEFVFAMAYNRANGQMYALCNENNPYIAEVNLTTGALTPVVTIQQTGAVNLGLMCMTIDGNGNFYGLSFSAISAKLVSIDISTGACTQLMATGLDTYYAQSMTYDVVNDRIYWAHADNGSNYKNGLYVIDMANGYEMTHLGQIGDNGSDLEITALYVEEEYTPAAETHTLTVNYVDERGDALEEPYVGEFEEGESYYIESPSIRDYETDTPVVSGVMGDRDIEIYVVYTPVEAEVHELTVNYVYAGGGAAAPSYTGTFEEGAAYSVESPVREGYTPDIAVVEGIMGEEDITVTVIYTADPQPGGLIGDANADGAISSADLSALFAYVMNAGSLTEQGLLNSDINGDGSINTLDVTLLAQL